MALNWRRFVYWLKHRRWSVPLTISALVFGASGIGIYYVASWEDGPSRIGWLSALGAVLSVAVVGLAYEVGVRESVEDSTLEKIGLSRAVFSSGLVSVEESVQVDWPKFLSISSHFIICAQNPEQYLSEFEEPMLRSASSGRILKVDFVVPMQGDSIPNWYDSLRQKWSEKADKKSCLRLLSVDQLNFDIFSANPYALMVLPSVCGATKVPGRRVILFKNRFPLSTTEWLRDQAEALAGGGAATVHSVNGRGAPPVAGVPAIRGLSPVGENSDSRSLSASSPTDEADPVKTDEGSL